MVTIALAAQIAAAAVQPGVADTLRDGRLCVAIPGPRLSPGAAVTLVQVHPPQSATVVRIALPIGMCDTLERATIAGRFYLVTPPANATLENGPWIAIRGRLPVRQRAGSVSIDLGTASHDAHVRSCTSTEGVHLTLWAGAPLKSTRLWRAYYYLGYDVEPSCDERDYAE